MERYNKHDVVLLERVYDRLLPWIKSHPNVTSGGHSCPHCASENLVRRGYSTSQTRRYARMQCKDCGTWSQAVASEPGSAALKAAA